MGYDYTKFDAGRGWYFERTRTVYGTTNSGAFKSAPAGTETEIVDAGFYINFVRSVPWFNDRARGESCRAQWNYTQAGYIPVRVVTSKRGYKKIVDTFEPIPADRVTTWTAKV